MQWVYAGQGDYGGFGNTPCQGRDSWVQTYGGTFLGGKPSHLHSQYSHQVLTALHSSRHLYRKDTFVWSFLKTVAGAQPHRLSSICMCKDFCQWLHREKEPAMQELFLSTRIVEEARGGPAPPISHSHFVPRCAMPVHFSSIAGIQSCLSALKRRL